MTPIHSAFLSVAIISLAAPASAESSEWSTDITSYMWFSKSVTKADTAFGTAESELSAKDALEQLKMGLMVTGTARRGAWAFTGDLIYFDLEEHKKTPFGALFSELETTRTFTALSGYAMYTAFDDATTRVEFGGGLRGVDSDVRLDLKGDRHPGAVVNINDSWIDALVAARIKHRLNQHWQMTLSMDLGGFGIGNSSRKTWQAVATINYQINDHWSLISGYRHLYIDRDDEGNDYSLEMSGPVLGMNYRF